jgi:hypothetical protein
MTRIRSKAARALLLLLPATLALSACEGDPFLPRFTTDLDEARATWERQGITSYRYTLLKVCGECPPESVAPARIEVRDGVPVSVQALTSSRPIDPAFFGDYDTVDELFDVIGDALAAEPYRFHARYDEGRGHPVGFSVDYDRQAVDDEAGFSVADFEVIP